MSLILVYTVLSIFRFNVKKTDGAEGNDLIGLRLETGQTIIGGLAEIFLSCMIWFITDDD